MLDGSLRGVSALWDTHFGSFPLNNISSRDGGAWTLALSLGNLQVGLI